MKTFIPNPAGIAMLGKSPVIQALLKARAEEIVEHAKSVAPVEEGDYRDSIHVEDGETPGTLMVIASNFKANWIEFGTVNMSPFQPLRQGVELAGLELHAGEAE